MDDNRLVNLLWRSGHGDHDAFSELYETTAPKLFALCKRLLGQREWAEEVLQEVYVRVWHQASDYTATKGRAMTWLVSITRNRAIDAMRRAGRRPEAPLDDLLLDRLAADGPAPAEAAAQDDAADALLTCMRRLTQAQQRCIELAFLNGLTHGEIVQRLEHPLGTVKAWIRRGLVSLKRCLTE